MTLNDFANLATIVQGIFVIVSICFIWYQLQESTRLSQAANAQTMVSLTSPFYLQIAQYPEIASLWYQGYDKWDKLDEIEKFRYRELVIWWLIFHENVYHQRKQKLMNTEAYNTWERGLQGLIEQTPKECLEDILKTAPFQPSFFNYLQQLTLHHTVVK